APQVVTETRASVTVGRGVGSAPVERVGFGVIGSCVPDGCAAYHPGIAAPAVIAGFAGAGNGVATQKLGAGSCIEGCHEATDVDVATSGADIDLVAHDGGRHGDGIVGSSIGHRGSPDQTAVACVDG